MLGRTWFLVVMFVAGLSAVAWAIYGSHLEPADFTFVNETEVASVDPALITGQPEGRIVASLFEGLCRLRPDNNKAEAGMADRWEISDDGRVYMFHLRDNVRWSNGDPVTARDFAYSIRRLIDPLNASIYSYQAWYIENAKKYNLSASSLKPGDPVEVELNPPTDAVNTFRGKLLVGKLLRMDGQQTKETKGDKSDSKEPATYIVEMDGKERIFRPGDEDKSLPDGVEHCRQVLLDFREVGVKAIDDRTLELRLVNRTPYFLDLLGFYPFCPVNQSCLEKYGKPGWVQPQNIVTNGPFKLVDRRLRDRVRLKRNDDYWDKEHVRLKIIDALSVEDRTTSFNLYSTGMTDWCTVPPPEVLRELLKSKPPRNDLNPAPQLTTYYFMLNTTRPPLNDKRVRLALALALNRDEITRVATGAGEIPALSLVPPSMPSYKQQPCRAFNPTEARKLLAEAGYPDGRGLPKLEILYNTDQQHQAIAELVRKQWQNTLGVTASLRNEEWGSFQSSQQEMKYIVARRAWVGDYLDPNTYLDMFVTNGENNCTGFTNAEYDKLIASAAKEPDEEKRMEMLENAERILMDEMPIIPVYFYVSRNMVRPHVRGFYNNLQDTHPLSAIWIDPNIKNDDPHPKNEYMEPVK
ncbi:MAG TPA: peptide ABC transporter substrate-binding protein [Lacipirellulaceae bacterium]|nr:peptide ABC transporter substrate-binding protein [Lacipirellulaceae bacterium]